MRESFTEYKKTLEQNLMNISYLYNGDVISSADSCYIEIKNSPLTSPSFIINSISNIYQESIDIMISKSKEFIIPLESLNDVGKEVNMFDKISELGIKPLYSPLIKDDDDELILYVVDRSIQSLVYSIQNMDYKIEQNDKDNIEWKHTMEYNLYDCRFNSYRLSIKNLSKLRNDKINKILNGN